MSVEEVHDHEEQNLSDPLVRTLPSWLQVTRFSFWRAPAPPPIFRSGNFDPIQSWRCEYPFNIQVEAVMDNDGADQIVHRLQSLGYPASADTTE
jgi:hypothetical protein